MKIPSTVIVTVMPVGGISMSKYKQGVKVIESKIDQSKSAGLFPWVKTTNYLTNIFEKNRAEQKQFYDSLLLKSNKEITEFTTANFFAMADGNLITPGIESGSLPGITRSQVIKIANRMSCQVKERPIFSKEIPRMSEVFMTTSLRGVLPVIQIGQKLVGMGKVGKFTKEISRLYNTEKQRNREKYGKFLNKRMKRT